MNKWECFGGKGNGTLENDGTVNKCRNNIA